jgi:hypothetical protein
MVDETLWRNTTIVGLQNKIIFCYGSIARCWALAAFFSFLVYTQSVGLLGEGAQPVAKPLPTHRTTQTQTSMPEVGFEPTNPVFERAKTVHALDRVAIIIGSTRFYLIENSITFVKKCFKCWRFNLCKTTYAYNKREAFLLKCWSLSEDSHHWPKHVKALFYY